MFVPRNTLIGAGTPCLLSSVSSVLTASARPKIFSYVVKSVVVPMIVLPRLWQASTPCHERVHINDFLPPPILINGHVPARVPQITVSGFEFGGKPIPLGEEFKVTSINSGRFPLSQFNLAGSIFHSVSFGRPVSLMTTGLPS